MRLCFITLLLDFLCVGFSMILLALAQDPLKLDVVISFPDHGFHLRFDPWSQVLFY